MKTVDQIDMKKLKEVCGSLNAFIEEAEVKGLEKIRTTAVKNEEVLENFAAAIKTIAKAGKGDDLPEDVILMSNDIFAPASKEKAKTEKPKKAKKPKEEGPKSRYGHKEGSQAAQLDDLLFKGTTIPDAAQAVGTKNSRVKSHILHLQKKKGLKIEEKEGVYKVVS